MSSDITEVSSIDIFEVFKLKTEPKEKLQSLDIESIKRSYVELVPITSESQIKEATALAVIPDTGL